MNVDGAFILAELCKNQEDLSASVCWQQHADISQILRSHYEFGKMRHIFFYKNEQMMSKCSAEFPGALNPGAALFEYMPFVRVLENITFCSLFASPFHEFNHHSNQQQPPLPLLIGDMRSSLSLSVFRAYNDVCVSLSLWPF